jgi:dipeptidyl aminopeptidase/acylaminoacyl peptidase
VTVQQGLYRCAVAWGAVTDPKLMLQEESPGGRKSDAQRYWRRFMGADAPGGGDLDAVSPLHLAARTDAPVLVMYGRDDTVVSPDQSKAMIKALKAAAKPVEIAVMPGEDHWLSKGATRTAMLEAAVDFVQKHNPAD